jgi:creatinine amidohydrolase
MDYNKGYKGASMEKSFLSDMTWMEFRQVVDSNTVAVIPTGSMELEGPHLPLGVDSITAEHISGKLDGDKGVVIAPLLPIGYSKWFNPFPGTISLEHETQVRLLTDYTTSLIRHGIRRIVFLNSHRGNNSAIEVVSRNLVEEYNVRIGMISVWKLANDLTAKHPGMINEGKFTHAGEIMTSLILAIRPDTVVKEHITGEKVKSPPNTKFIVKNSLGETLFQDCIQILYQDTRDVTEKGTMGDPTPATAEKGEKIIGMIVEYTKAFISEFRKLPISERE